MRTIKLISLFCVTSTFVSCSAHPLPDRVIGYSTSQILQKLRCEAQYEIWKHIDDLGLKEKQLKILETQRKKNEWDEFRENNKTFLSSVDSRLSSINKRGSDAVALARKANNLLKSIKIKTQNLDNDLINADNALEKKAIIRRLEIENLSKIKLNSELKHALWKAKEIAKEKKLLVETIKNEFNEKKLNHNDNYLIQITFKEYQRLLKRKEIAEQVLSSNQSTKKLRDLHILNLTSLAMRVRFDIKETNVAKTSGTLGWPSIGPGIGSLSLALEKGIDKSRQRDRSIKTVSTFQELSDKHLLECERNEEQNFAEIYPLRGNTGIGEFIKQYFQVQASNHTVLTKEEQGYTDTLTFTTKLTAGINPKIQITKYIPTLADGSFDYDTTRDDIHAVTAAVIEPDLNKTNNNGITTSDKSKILLSIEGGLDGKGRYLITN